MYSKNIDIAPSTRVVLPAEYPAREFTLSTRPALWAFIEALPGRIAVGSIKKLYVELGPSAFNAQPWRILDGVGFYAYPHFDYAAYRSATRTQQQKDILDALHNAAVFACNDQGADSGAFDAAYEIVRSQSFPLPELTIDEVLEKLGLR